MKSKLQNLHQSYCRWSIVALFLFGVVSGIPLVLAGSTLGVWMCEEGISIKTIGYFSIVTTPYSFKFLWAPFIDSFEIPFLYRRFGRRRSWLIVTQILLSITVICFSQKNIVENMLSTAIYVTCIAFLAATQDIIIDAFRLEFLVPEDQGVGTAANIFGFRVGMLIAGAGALYGAHFFAWDIIYSAMGIIIAFGLIVTFTVKEPTYIKKHNFTNLAQILHHNVVTPLQNFTIKPKWYYIFILVIIYKLPDAFAGHMATPFFIHLGFTKIQIATIVKTYGFVATISGCFLGSYMILKIGIMRALLFAAFLQILSNFTCFTQCFMGNSISFLTLAITIEHIFGGIQSTVFVAFLSNLCTNKEFTATEYALLSSLSSFGRTFLSSPSGHIVALLGWPSFFIFCCLVGVLPIIVIKLFSKYYDEKLFLKKLKV